MSGDKPKNGKVVPLNLPPLNSLPTKKSLPGLPRPTLRMGLAMGRNPEGTELALSIVYGNQVQAQIVLERKAVGDLVVALTQHHQEMKTKGDA